MIEMKQPKHRNLIRWLMRVAIAFVASLNITVVAAGEFGFNYWPQGVFGCDAFGTDTIEPVTDARWSVQKPRVAADLDYMKSLGATVLRLPFWPGGSGFKLRDVENPQVETSEACKKLPEMLALIKSRGFKVIIAFANARAVDKSPNSWTDVKKYMPSPVNLNGENLFAEDSVKWINSIVNLIESPANSPELSSMILYYDMVNEYDHRVTTLANYFRWVYLNSNIPQNKKGVSVLTAKGTTAYGSDVDGLPIPPGSMTQPWYSIKQQLAALSSSTHVASLSFVDFHSYPFVPNTDQRWGCPANPDTANSYDYIRQAFPSATKVVLGEFGRRVQSAPNDQVEETRSYLDSKCGSSIPPSPANSSTRKWNEAGQKETVEKIVSIATTKNIPYYLHWMLWDNSPPVRVSDLDPAAQNYGMGYEPHRPKDVLGSVAARFSMIPNSDFEVATSAEVVTGWSKGGATQGTSLRSSYVAPEPEPPDQYAATNRVYARLEATPACGSTCTAWIQSDLIDISGLPVGGKIYVNAYVRSNFTDVSVNIAQFNGTTQLASSTPKTITPSAHSWLSYLHRIYETGQVTLENGSGFKPDSNATHVIVTIGGTANTATSNAYLDVDTVSMHW